MSRARVRAGRRVIERQLLLPAVHLQEGLRLGRVGGAQGRTDAHHHFHLGAAKVRQMGGGISEAEKYEKCAAGLSGKDA